MRKIHIIGSFAAGLLAAASAAVSPSVAWAASKCGDVKTAVDYGCDSGNPIFGILLAVINFLAIGVGVAVAGGIVYGGLRYITSNGNSAQTQQAIHIIVNAVLGLVLFGFMYALLNYLVPGGALN